jgi:hypothetical protein
MKEAYTCMTAVGCTACTPHPWLVEGDSLGQRAGRFAERNAYPDGLESNGTVGEAARRPRSHALLAIVPLHTEGALLGQSSLAHWM